MRRQHLGALVLLASAIGLAPAAGGATAAADPPSLAGLGVAGVTASDDDGNVAAHTRDDDLATRWSAKGDGQWIAYRLRRTATVGAVQIAWHRGHRRVADFEIQTARDDGRWRTVFEGSSSGTRLTPQTYRFAAERADRLRIVGSGNTENDWNSITEVRLRGSHGPVTQDPPDPEPRPAVFRQTFDDEPLGRFRDDGLEVRECAGHGRCLRARYEPTRQGSDRMTYRETLPPAREYTVSYQLRFGPGFEWVRGGKLPGLGPDDPVTGCDPMRGDGWSARLMWRSEARLVQYLYHQDKTQDCGDDVEAEDFALEAERWYDIALAVRVNAASAADGEVRLFVDGREVARRDGLRLRTTGSDGLIEQFMFATFYGGNDPSWAPSRPTEAFFDDFVVRPGFGPGTV